MRHTGSCLLTILTFIMLAGQSVWSQSRSLARKETIASKILERIGAAYGFDVLGLPKVVIYPKGVKNRHMAHLDMLSAGRQPLDYSLYRSRLIMDEELFDLCVAIDRKRADGAGTTLAFVLSHEMAHFYHRHATFRSFADGKKGAMPETVSTQQERQADQTGLLFAYLAGYDPEPVVDTLFDALYTHYQLNDVLWGYPEKSVRQRSTKLKATEFQTYGYLLAIGHALYCQGMFAEAARCFEHVFTRYPLKEAYNNFGVCRLQQISHGRKKDPISYYALPFEIDPRNRLLRMGERGGPGPLPELATWINEADVAFGRAIELDITYQPAYLNQATGALLTNNAFLALGILTNLAQKTQRPLPPNGYLLQGIAHGATGNWLTAQQNFTKATEQRAYQATYNTYVAQAVRQQKLATLRQPWQRLQTQPTARTALGCQSGNSWLQEIDVLPKSIHWPGTYLMEHSTPRPYVFVESTRLGAATYFRVEINQGKSVPPFYFVRKGQ